MLTQSANIHPSQKEKIVAPSLTPSEIKFKQSELRYRRLFEAARDGILILDADSGKIADVNPYLKEMLGYPESELLGKQLWEIGVFKDIVDSKKAFLELQSSGYIRYKDLPLQTKDGQKIDVEFVSNVYLVDTKKVIQCNIRDITDRRKAEKLAESRARELERLTKSQEETKQAMLNVMEDLESARALIEVEKVKDEAMLASIGEGLIAVNNEKKIMIINRAAEDMLGLKLKDMVGKPLTSFLLEDEAGQIIPEEDRPINIALASGKTTSKAFFYARKDKSRFPIAITVTPIKLAGKTIGAIDIFRDITHEKEVDRAKSEFVSLASHQLRTPLGIIKWYLEALKNEAYFKKAPAGARGYFDEIYKSNERVLSLVRDLLSVSRIEQGQVKNIPEPVSLLKAISEVVSQMQIIAGKKNIRLKLTIHDRRVPNVNIDSIRFHEVMENLIGNAIEYTGVGGSVDVKVRLTGKMLIIIVKDTGIGISSDDQKKLFTKFFRSEKAFGYSPEGSGLGLYLVKAYVQGWGGTISVESREGFGSTFTMTMPILQKNDKQKES